MSWQTVCDVLASVRGCIPRLLCFPASDSASEDRVGDGDVEQPPGPSGLECLLEPHQNWTSGPAGRIISRRVTAEPADGRGTFSTPVGARQPQLSAPIDIPRRPRSITDDYYRPRRWHQPDFQLYYQVFRYVRYYYKFKDFNQRFPMRYMPTSTQSWPPYPEAELAVAESRRRVAGELHSGSDAYASVTQPPVSSDPSRWMRWNM